MWKYNMVIPAGKLTQSNIDVVKVNGLPLRNDLEKVDDSLPFGYMIEMVNVKFIWEYIKFCIISPTAQRMKGFTQQQKKHSKQKK